MRRHDQHNVGGFLPKSDNCQNYSHLFQIHRKQDQDGGSQVNHLYSSLYWYTWLTPSSWSMTATKRHKKSFGQNPTFPLCCRLIDVLEDQKIYRTVHSRQGDTLILPEEMFEESESENWKVLLKTLQCLFCKIVTNCDWRRGRKPVLDFNTLRFLRD